MRDKSAINSRMYCDSLSTGAALVIGKIMSYYLTAKTPKVVTKNDQQMSYCVTCSHLQVPERQCQMFL